MKQGKLGNCYFLSACAVLTQKNDILLQAFMNNDYNEQGVYSVRFYKNGHEINIIIDALNRYYPIEGTKQMIAELEQEGDHEYL